MVESDQLDLVALLSEHQNTAENALSALEDALNPQIDANPNDKLLMEMLDVVTDDPERPRWQQIMREQVREQIIFDGDHDTYATAKKASDGLEHGFLELDDVARRAIASADTTFTCVRRTIIDLLDLPREIGTELMEIKPTARKAIRGWLLGAAADPVAQGEMYPRLEWTSLIDSVVREGAAFQMKAKEQVTVRTNPAVQFSFDRIEMIGRLAEGEQPTQLSEDDLNVTRTPGAGSAELMNAVMPLVDAAVETGAETPYDGAWVMAFNLFGQGVAFSRAPRA